MSLAAEPVSPDVEVDSLAAPLLAKLSALPAAWVSPVLPESPELPDPTLFRPMIARPLSAVFKTPRVALTLPVLPVPPESPLCATGLDHAVELAPPVLPVLVAEDCAVDAPELPDRASGSWVPLTSPPAPPSAETLAMESPEARASPVRPESPLCPDVMPPVTPARPLMPVFRTPMLALASPLFPVPPESPVPATGLPTAVELAPPVSPVLVEDDWAHE